jgi:hypothetical protein
MKMNRLIFASLVVFVPLFTIVRCTKDKTTTPTQGAFLKAFFDKNAPKAETFTFTATQTFTVTTSKGTTILFPANNLLDETGKIVTGAVVVTVKELATPADMLLSDKPTVISDGGGMLISFGEIKVDAKQNGKALRINDTIGLNVNMAFAPNAAQNRQMPLWVGDTTVSVTKTGLNSDGVQTAVTTDVPAMKGVTWATLSGFNTFAVTNTTTNKVNFKLDKLGEWRNCDVLYSDTRPKTTILGYFSTNYNKETESTYQGLAPSNLFFKPKGQNTLIKLYNVIVTPTAGKEGFYSYINTIPIGMEGTFLAISTIDGKFYAEMKDVTITAPATGKAYMGITFSPVEISEADLLAKITLMNSK